MRSAHQAGRWAPGSVAAIGKFDGIHLGHQKVISAAVDRAKQLATKALVVTFDPTPQEFFQPGTYKPILTQDQAHLILEGMDVDGVLYLPFTGKLACQAPEAFARDVLMRAMKVLEVCVGEDFCFGKDRAGRVDDLKQFGQEFSFLVRPIPLVYADGEKISSSLIRRLLDAGRRPQAEAFLGRSLP